MSVIIRTGSDLGAAIRERRMQLGLDQGALAAKAGTSRKWIIEVENGKPRAEIGLIFRTLKALGLAMSIGDTAADGVRAKPSKARARQRIDLDQIIDALKRSK